MNFNAETNNSKESERAKNRTLDSFLRRSSAQDLYKRNRLKTTGKIRRFRSMSDITEKTDSNEDENVEVFPSLSDNVLQELGLGKEETRERISSEELESKFSVLSLAFSIDSTTIRSRYERQKRYRDQAEKNLNVEIKRLVEKANRLNKLCVDMESTALLSELLDQIEKVSSASLHATSTAERYGAVQHEDKLSEGVQLMIGHVNYLKQQRDQSRLQLQYTKKVLQESSNDVRVKYPVSEESSLRRRATVANTNIQSKLNQDEKKISRRISESTLKAVKTTKKPSRLDLSLDLDKIKEGASYSSEPDCSDTDTKEISGTEENLITVPLHRNDRQTCCVKILSMLKEHASEWPKHLLSKEAFIVCAVFFVLLSLIILCNIFFELQLAKT